MFFELLYAMSVSVGCKVHWALWFGRMIRNCLQHNNSKPNMIYPHKSCVWLFSESEGTGCCTNKRHKKVSYFGWNFSPHVIGNLLAASALSSWGNARKASKRDCFSASPSFPPVLPYLFMYTLHNRLNSFLLQRVDKLWFRPGYPAKKST